MAVYNFSETNGTLLTDIVSGILRAGGTSEFRDLGDLSTNGAGQLQNTREYTTTCAYLTGSNQSKVSLVSGYNGSSNRYVAPIIACDADNNGYRAYLTGATDTAFSRVDFTKDGAYLASSDFSAAIETTDGPIDLDLRLSGTTVTCDVYQNGALYETRSATDATPLTRTGSGFMIKHDTVQSQLLDSWDNFLSGANQAPTANDETYSIQDDVSNGHVVGTFTATDSDGTIASYSITGTTLAIDNAGQITIADNTGITAGVDITATVTATDDDGATDTALITVNVTAPALIIDAVSDATPDVGSQIIVDFHNELDVVTAGDFNVASQSAGQAVIDIPNPTTFILSGQTYPTLPFLANVTIPLNDGTNTANATVQIQPETGYTYTQIADIHADGYYADVPGLAVGMFAYWRITGGDTVFDATDGRGSAGPAGGTVEIQFYNGEWGAAETITYPAYSADIVSIDSLTPARNGAVVEFSYPNVDVTAFQYSTDGTNWAAATSPLTINGLTEETQYTLLIRPVLDGSPGASTSQVFTTLPAIDNTPDAFSFVPQGNAARSVYATSSTITVQGVDAGVDIPVTVSNGEYSVSTDNGATWGAWSSTGQNVRLNYQLRVRHTTAATYNTGVSTTLTVGGVAATFTSTTLVDSVAPVITLTGGNVSIEQGTPWVELGYSAIDNADGDISVTGVVVTGAVDEDVLGPHTLTYTATDAAGNVAVATRIVTVVEAVQQDAQSPVISLVGGNILLSEGDAWVEPGYSAVDDTDGDITGSVSVSGSVNAAIPGSYELTYTATDAAGNVGSVTRTVTVVAAIIYPTVSNAPDTRTFVASRASRIEMGEAIFTKQPDEVLDYDFDLTEVLAAENDTLPEGNFSIDTNSDYLEVVGSGIIPGTSRVKVWLSGGEHGTSGRAYPVELTIITAGYRTAKFLMRVVVIDRVL